MQARPRPEDQAEAERLLNKALRLDPDLPEAHLGLARVSTYLYVLGIDESPARLASAAGEARKAVELAPADPRARAALALALVASDRLTPALEEARRAVAIGPGSAEAHAALGIVLRLRLDLDEALEECRRAGEIAPASPGILVALGETLREKGRYEEALEMFGQAIDLDQKAIVPQLAAAACLHKEGRLDAASRLYNLLQARWDYGQNRVRLGTGALLVAAQDYESALEIYGRIEIPANGSVPTLLALYGKGYSLLKLGRPAEAEYFLSTLIERTPRDYDGPARGREIVFRAYDALAGFFEARGHDRKVEAILRSACERPLAPTRFARRLALRLESPAFLEEAILAGDPREDPIELAESALALARLRSSGGKQRIAADSAATRALRRAAETIAATPTGVAHYRMGRAFSLAGNRTDALASLERARAAGYLPAELLAQERDFDGLRDDPAFQALTRP